MRWAVAAFASIIASSVSAADFGPPRGVSISFNATAAAQGDRTARMVLRECGGKNDHRCMFSMPGKISILAIADEAKTGGAQLITLVSDRQSDPKAFVNACLFAMQTWSPKVQDAEVAAAFKILFRPPLKNDLPRSVQLGDVKYTINDFVPGALAFIVADASLP